MAFPGPNFEAPLLHNELDANTLERGSTAAISVVTVLCAEYPIALKNGRGCVDSYAIYGICSLLGTFDSVWWDPWTVGKVAECVEGAL